MKFYSLVITIALFTAASCKKNNTPILVEEPTPMGSVDTSKNVTFVSSAHTTTGKVVIITNSNGKKSLSFENFATDNGPDLRVYLSTSVMPNKAGEKFIDLGVLKAVSGSFSYEINSSIDLSTHKHVLIWCEDFSVLFGYAVLK